MSFSDRRRQRREWSSESETGGGIFCNSPELRMGCTTATDAAGVAALNVRVEMKAGSFNSAHAGVHFHRKRSGMARDAVSTIAQAAFCATRFFTRRIRRLAHTAAAARSARRTASSRSINGAGVTACPPCREAAFCRPAFPPLRQCASQAAAVHSCPEPWSRPCRPAALPPILRRTSPRCV